MPRCATAAVLAVLASVPLASAADKPARPSGTWTRTVNEFTVTFTFQADTLTCDVSKTSGESIVTQAAYGVTADGVLFGFITNVDKKGTDAGPEKGDLFSFTMKLDKDTLKFGDFNSSRGRTDQAAQLLEGEYQKK